MIKLIIPRLTREGVLVQDTESPEIFDIKDEFVTIEEPLYYKLTASLVNNGVLVRGEAEINIKATCSLCMEEFKMNVKNSEVCHFYEKPNKTEIDLTEDIREDILILFPMRYKCSEDCKGICPKCGQNLNNKSCSCSQTEEGIWQELDNLDL